MLKKILLLLLCFCLIFAFSACRDDPPADPTPPDDGGEDDGGNEDPYNPVANSYTVNDNIYIEVHDGGILYVKGTGAMPDDILIPNDQPWYSHGANTRTERSDEEGGALLIGTIIVEEGITRISDNAFYDFKRVEKVQLPSTLEEIGYRAFKDCTKLKTVVGGNGVTVIEAEAFKGCSALESIELSPALREVQDAAFSGIHALNPNKKLTLKIKGTPAAWELAKDTLVLGFESENFIDATVTFTE